MDLTGRRMTLRDLRFCKKGRLSLKATLTLGIVLLLTVSCGTPQSRSAPAATSAMSPEEATLSSLQLVDDYPLYTMHYSGPYTARANPAAFSPSVLLAPPAATGCLAQWSCSLFATLSDEENHLLGRNFDWQFSPALLLFTEPADGYASVSMVDIAYLGFTGPKSKELKGLSLEELRPLLEAPSLPFDGMNEKGLAVGMAAVPPGNMRPDPQKKTLDELQAIREILDHAGTVEEAIEILRSHNIDMGAVPIHYLIASASGESAVVEFYEGQMMVFRNQSPWQVATNFLLASTNGKPQGQCWRYDRISQRLKGLQGRISSTDAMQLLSDVSQENTQWSVVYHMTSGDVDAIMGRQYSGAIHTFHLEQSAH